MLTKQLQTIKWVNFNLTSYNFFPIHHFILRANFCSFRCRMFFMSRVRANENLWFFNEFRTHFYRHHFHRESIECLKCDEIGFSDFGNCVQWTFGFYSGCGWVYVSHCGICMSHASKLIVERIHLKFKKCVRRKKECQRIWSGYGCETTKPDDIHSHMSPPLLLNWCGYWNCYS